MKYLSLAIALCTFLLSCKTTHIYIVRHGEKAGAMGDNPHLTNEGNTRANVLKDLLSSKDVQHVYSTNYFRTIETANPTATKHNLAVEYYKNDTLGRFVHRVKRNSGTTLIVGHSNTVLTILDSFHVRHNVSFIPESDYDNLFILTLQNGKVKALTETTYGKATQ